MRRKIKKSVAVISASATLTAGVGLMATPSMADSGSLKDSPSLTEILKSQSISREDWLDVARSARGAGDLESAEAATKFAELANQSTSGDSPQGLSGVAKQALKILLKYGKDKLPAPIRPYADKILKALDKIDEIAETPIAAALQQSGMDPATAAQTAKYIVTFLQTFGPI